MTHDIEVRATGHARLGSRDVRTLLLSALGGALEFYDFVIFVFFTKELGQLFFPAHMPAWLAQLQVFGIFAAGYLARPLGGVVMAHFGDRVGRKRMFSLSVFLMALPTLCIGLLPVYAQVGILAPLLLLLMRVVQGVAIGGEVPGAWVFVAEHVPASRVGFACASLTSGLTAGILIGSLVATGITSHYPEATVLDFAWRIPFLLGGIFGFLAVYLRRWLHETPVFAQMRERRELADELPVKRVIRDHLPGVVLSMLVTWLLTAAIVVVILMTPTLVQSVFHIDRETATRGGSAAALALTIGCLVAGLAVDRLGRARTLLPGAVLLLASTYALYVDLVAGGQHFMALYTLAGFFVGVVGAVPAVMVAAFPPAVRFSGISFSYNVAYAVFGAATPPLVSFMASRLGPMAPAHYVACAAVFGGIATGIYLLRTGRTFYER
ncbi:MFS family permease [Luteibacter sp. Sphag1AF]|uniref:MFS transporter n=1 Tax=Luteibacter sp. Sphag1AF TaxID=2587031 RepID=UPI00161FF75C|nr:MFS transporter [Luteibacter sp. Sphag1AF]MBB3228370.1 MFS family permease [Luteibacter sp. Sphag1AF]